MRVFGEKSIDPLFAISWSSRSYTQWRGNGDAPTISPVDVPPGCTQSESVVQAVGGVSRRYGGSAVRRGSGIPVRPPAVWTNVTPSAVIFGSRWVNGKDSPGTLNENRPSRVVVHVRFRRLDENHQIVCVLGDPDDLVALVFENHANALANDEGTVGDHDTGWHRVLYPPRPRPP